MSIFETGLDAVDVGRDVFEEVDVGEKFSDADDVEGEFSDAELSCDEGEPNSKNCSWIEIFGSDVWERSVHFWVFRWKFSKVSA